MSRAQHFKVFKLLLHNIGRMDESEEVGYFIEWLRRNPMLFLPDELWEHIAMEEDKEEARVVLKKRRCAANVASAGTGGLGAPPRPVTVTVGANQVVGEKRFRFDGNHTFKVMIERKSVSAIECQKEKVELLSQMPNQAARYEAEQQKLLDMYDAAAVAATAEEAP